MTLYSTIIISTHRRDKPARAISYYRDHQAGLIMTTTGLIMKIDVTITTTIIVTMTWTILNQLGHGGSRIKSLSVDCHFPVHVKFRPRLTSSLTRRNQAQP